MSNKTSMQDWNNELQKRLLTIKSEPDGDVRETMINNFLIDSEKWLTKERKELIDARAEVLSEVLAINVNAPRKYCEEWFDKKYKS